MGDSSTPAVARAYATRLHARFGARLVGVRLFGSYARGDADETSDIDVLVLIADLSVAEKIEAGALATEVALPTGLTLSPLVMSPRELDRLRALEARLALDVDREGVAL